MGKGTVNKTKKKINKAKFEKTTPEIEKHDRKHYLSGEMIETVKEGTQLRWKRLLMDRLTAIINFRKEQLGEGKFVSETFEGRVKSPEMLQAELRINVQEMKDIVMDYNQRVDKLKTEQKFTDDTILEIINGNFDWTAWKEKKQKEIDANVAEIKDTPEVKPDVEETKR